MYRRLRPFNLLRRYPFLSSFMMYTILAAAVAGIVYWSYGRDTRFGFQQIPVGASGVALMGHAHGLDLTSQTLTIMWEILGCGAYKIPSYPPTAKYYSDVGCDHVLDRAVDIYLNSVSNSTFSYDPAVFPLTLTNQTRYVNTLNDFYVDHRVDFIASEMTPFESYFFTASVFVIEKATNKSVPIVAFAAGEAADNFIVLSNEEDTKSRFTYDSGVGPTTVEVESRVVSIEARRSRLAKAFTMCMLLINWGLAIASVYVTVALIVVPRKEKMEAAVFLLPVTVVLTIPNLRGLYVGSPSFGIYIDSFGFFLQMMTVAVCSIVLMCIVAAPKPGGEQHTSRDNESTK